MVKGRLKVSFELTGYQELLRVIIELVKNILIGVFACVLFAGSCVLCSTTIGPMVNSVPLVSLIGFISSVALGIYSIRNLVKIGEKL
jgi:ubiquinone biosynthesis protein